MMNAEESKDYFQKMKAAFVKKNGFEPDLRNLVGALSQVYVQKYLKFIEGWCEKLEVADVGELLTLVTNEQRANLAEKTEASGEAGKNEPPKTDPAAHSHQLSGDGSTGNGAHSHTLTGEDSKTEPAPVN